MRANVETWVDDRRNRFDGGGDRNRAVLFVEMDVMGKLQTFLATDHQTRFEISADGKTCKMQVLVHHPRDDFAWRTIVWFRDVGPPPGNKSGKNVKVCPYCFMFNPGAEHIKNCQQGQNCVNCGYIEESHDLKVRRNALASGHLIMSCNHFQRPAPSMLGPAQRAMKALKVPNAHKLRAAARATGPKGARARKALRGIAPTGSG